MVAALSFEQFKRLNRNCEQKEVFLWTGSRARLIFNPGWVAGSEIWGALKELQILKCK